MSVDTTTPVPQLVTVVVPSRDNAQALTRYAREHFLGEGKYLDSLGDEHLEAAVCETLLMQHLNLNHPSKPITADRAMEAALRVYARVMGMYQRTGALPVGVHFVYGSFRDVCYLADPSAGTDGALLPRTGHGEPFEVEFNQDARKVGMRQVRLCADLLPRC